LLPPSGTSITSATAVGGVGFTDPVVEGVVEGDGAVAGGVVAGAVVAGSFVVGVGGCVSLSFEHALCATLKAQLHAIRTTLVLDFIFLTPG